MKERYLINSILRACRILKCLSADPGSLKTSELARSLHLDRSTAYRIILSLEKCGLVEKKDKTGEYSLGVGAFEIGSAYLRRVDLAQVAKPIMADLALKVQETVHLAVLSETEILYIDRVVSPRSLGVISKIGQRGPVYCTALGKVLLASLPPEERLRIMDQIRFQAFTPRTITSKRKLAQELNRVKKKGYALDCREIERRCGMRCRSDPGPPGQCRGGPERFGSPEEDQHPERTGFHSSGNGGRGSDLPENGLSMRAGRRARTEIWLTRGLGFSPGHGSAGFKSRLQSFPEGG